jgi:hypothetical protein
MSNSRERRNNADEFEVLPSKKMQEKCGLYGENASRIVLNPANVPEPLRVLIPLAERWGINDDLMREDRIAKAPPEELAALTAAINRYEDELDDWLAGPEADSPGPSEEYIAFSAMRMAADGVT